MKKIKLVFALLMVSAFVAISITNNNSVDNQAIRKDVILPTNA